MNFKFGVTLLRFEGPETSQYDLRVERVFEEYTDRTKRTDYVFIPLTPQQVRFLEGIDIPTETISHRQEEED